MRQNVEELVEMIARIKGVEDLTLTTNGYLLKQKAQLLKDAGLNRVTVSLDSLDNNVFQIMNGKNYSPDRVLDGIVKAHEVGLQPIKINAVVQRGVNDHTIVDLARHFKGTGHIVRFIEYMDVGNLNGWDLNQVVTVDEIVSKIHSEIPLEPLEPNYPGEVARRYRYKDGNGEIGVITSVSNPFCGNCTRARLSTDGKLYTCLFAQNGQDLRGPMRKGATDDQIIEIITKVWQNRVDKYSEDRSSLINVPKAKIEMYQIGG